MKYLERLVGKTNKEPEKSEESSSRKTNVSVDSRNNEGFIVSPSEKIGDSNSDFSSDNEKPKPLSLVEYLKKLLSEESELKEASSINPIELDEEAEPQQKSQPQLPLTTTEEEKVFSPRTQLKKDNARKRLNKSVTKVIAANKVIKALKEPVDSRPLTIAPHVKRIIEDLATNQALVVKVLDILDSFLYDQDYLASLGQSINATSGLDSLTRTIGAIITILRSKETDKFERLVKDGLLIKLTNIECARMSILFNTIIEHKFVEDITRHELSAEKYDCLNKIHKLDEGIQRIADNQKTLSAKDKEKIENLKHYREKQKKTASRLNISRLDRVVFDLRNFLGLKPKANLHDLLVKGRPIIDAIIDDEQNYGLLRKAVKSYANYQQNKTQLEDLKRAVLAITDLVHKDRMLPLLFDFDKILTMQQQLESVKVNKAELLGKFLSVMDNQEEVILNAAMGSEGLKKIIPKILALPNIREKLKLDRLSSEQLEAVEKEIIPKIMDDVKNIAIIMFRDHKEELMELAKIYDDYKAIIIQYPPAKKGESEQALVILLENTAKFFTNFNNSINKAQELEPATRYVSQYLCNIVQTTLLNGAIEKFIKLHKPHNHRQSQKDIEETRKLLIAAGIEFLNTQKDNILDQELVPQILASSVLDQKSSKTLEMKNFAEAENYKRSLDRSFSTIARKSLKLDFTQAKFFNDLTPAIVNYLENVVAVALSNTNTPELVESYILTHTKENVSEKEKADSVASLIHSIMAADVGRALLDDGALADMVNLILEDSTLLKSVYLNSTKPDDSLEARQNTILAFEVIELMCEENNRAYLSGFVALALLQPESYNLIKSYVEKREKSEVLLNKLMVTMGIAVGIESDLPPNQEQKEILEIYKQYRLKKDEDKLNELTERLENFITKAYKPHNKAIYREILSLYKQALHEEEILSNNLKAFLNNTNLQEYVINHKVASRLITTVLENPNLLKFISEVRYLKKDALATTTEEHIKAENDRNIELEITRVITHKNIKNALTRTTDVILSQPEINKMVADIIKYTTSEQKDSKYFERIMHSGMDLLAKPEVQNVVVDSLEKVIKMSLNSEILSKKINDTTKFFKADINDLVKVVGAVLPVILTELNNNLKSSEKSPSFKKIENLLIKATAISVTSTFDKTNHREGEWKKWAEELFTIYKQDPEIAKMINKELLKHKDAIAPMINTAIDSIDDNKFKLYGINGKSVMKGLVFSGILDGKAIIDIVVAANNSDVVSSVESLLKEKSIRGVVGVVPGLVCAFGKAGAEYTVGRAKEIANYFFSSKSNLRTQDERALVSYREIIRRQPHERTHDMKR